MKAAEILRLVYGGDFDHYHGASVTTDLRGWTDPSGLFQHLGRELEPTDYLEVGSWLGLSAIRAARTMPTLESVTCVDTWLGAAEHWIDSGRPDHDMARDQAGQPGLYRRFLRNIASEQLEDKVAPVRLPSAVAAEIMEHHGLAWDIVYLDGSHSYHDVLSDLYSWWPLTRKIMVGDDWADPRFGVAAAVTRFLSARETARPANLRVDGNFWMIIR